MNTKLRYYACLMVVPLLAVSAAPANDTALKNEMKILGDQVWAKIKTGQATAHTLSPELAAIDELLAEHAGEKTEEVAAILALQASLYRLVVKDETKARTILQQLRSEFAGTPILTKAETQLTKLERNWEANQRQLALAVGTMFPDFSEPGLSGRPVTLSDFKGKVVLIDFWATWCKPCIAELPHVLEAYRRHHSQGFEIIGISLDRANARAKLDEFVRENNMPWAQIFDGQFWDSKLAIQFGVTHIPATYLLDQEGRIIAKNLRGRTLKVEIARLLASANPQTGTPTKPTSLRAIH